jgi:hypothetical protein
VLVELHKKHQ